MQSPFFIADFIFRMEALLLSSVTNRNDARYLKINVHMLSLILGKENDPCESDKDCKANHCCAYDNGQEICKPYLLEGDECGEHHRSRFPSFFASRFLEDGKKTRCPCLKGLKCQKKQ